MDSELKKIICGSGGPGTMMSPPRLLVLYLLLSDTIAMKIDGAVVEVGCHEGFSASFLRRIMDWWGVDIEYHVYDSFAGLRQFSEKDHPGIAQWPGMLGCEVQDLYRNFARQGLKPPIVHKGLVEETMAGELPTAIAFAHLDLDLYGPTKHALAQIHTRLTPGGAIVVDDFGHADFTGITPAVTEYCTDNKLCFSDLDLQSALLSQHQAVVWKPRKPY